MTIKLSALLLTLFFSHLVFAQIESFDDRNIHVSIGSELQSINLTFDNAISGRSLQYSPNLNGMFVPKIAYQDWFVLSWGFQTPTSELEKQLQGETIFTDTRFSFDLGSFRLSVFYLQYRGLYIENSQEVDPSLSPLQKIILPDLYTRSYGAEFTWIKNPERFSLKALTAQSERINGSGGSLLLGASHVNNRIEAPAGLFPVSINQDFGPEAELSIADLSTTSVKVGYGYATGRKWFIGGAIQAGPGAGTQKLVMIDGSSRSGTIGSLRLEALVSMGYNGDRFFSSIQSEIKQDYFYLKGSDTQIANQISNVVLNVGLHLDSLGF